MIFTKHQPVSVGEMITEEFMDTPLKQKSSIEEIRKRFDDDVERFSNIPKVILQIRLSRCEAALVGFYA
ncbi:MAG: hypothetical protein JRE65_15470 [Deltaproteobacteria bacterium]|jgi:hypothetical protein|nr:hypothetical protein [Deltaproteobacteria bacterium]